MGLANLADVAGANKPGDVGFHVRPPEVQGDVRFHSKDHFVTNIVVGSAHNVEMTFRAMTILWAPCESFHQSLPESKKNSVQYRTKVVYSESDKSVGHTKSSSHCLM